MFDAQFWKDTAERAVKTFAQALAAVFGADGLGLLNAPWGTALSTAGMAAVLSVLTSVASAGAGTQGTASLVRSRSEQPPAG
jgi:hypothetical protein